MEEQGQRRKQLVLVPCPFQGHINPMLHLGSILHLRGFSIIVAHTLFNFPNLSDHPDFIFLPISEGLSNFDFSSKDFIALISSINVSCKAPFKELLNQMIGKQENHNELPCIIYDEIMYYAEEVAHVLKIPSIVLSTTSAANLVAYYAIPQLQKQGLLPLQDDMSHELVPLLHPLRVKDLPIVGSKNLDAFLELIAAASDLRLSAAIILNTMDCLEHPSLIQLQNHCQLPIFAMGPLHRIAPVSTSSLVEEDYATCMRWLDKQAENYVSFGSISTLDEKKEVAETAWGLANSKQPFLWMLRPGSVPGSEATDVVLSDDFKETVGERGYIVKWAPQKEVLAHSAVGGFWSHCGWNSTLESINEGVPMICRPFFGDQRVNTRHISHVWRVGIELENVLERGGIERAIRRLMVEKEGEEMRLRASVLKSMIELCVKKGGSSYNFLNELIELITSF